MCEITSLLNALISEQHLEGDILESTNTCDPLCKTPLWDPSKTLFSSKETQRRSA